MTIFDLSSLLHWGYRPSTYPDGSFCADVAESTRARAEGKMKRILSTGAMFLALAGIALAEEPAGSPVFNWTGPYVGAFGGYGFGYAGATNDTGAGNGDGFDEGAADLTLGLTPRGAIGGVTLGYNHQSGAFVVGAEATGGFLALSDSFSDFIGDVPNGILDDDEGAVAYGWYATLTGRVGVALNRTLLFATAGGIITQYNGTYGDLDAGVTDPTDNTTLFWAAVRLAFWRWRRVCLRR